MITPAVEAQLNERQREMVLLIVRAGELTSRRCEAEFAITRDTANHDFNLLMELSLIRKEGKWRSTR